MIEAVRWQPFVRWFCGHAGGRIRETFAAVHVHGLHRLQAAVHEAPALVIANHSSWWDPLVALWLGEMRLEGAHTYGMMNVDNLRRYRFFRWLGCFGVDRTSRRDGARASRYAIDLLRRRGNLVWVFPQGEEQPSHVPLRFELGAAGIAKRAPAARVIPVALAFVFEGEEHPHVYVSVGEPMAADAVADRDAQARAVDRERCRIQRQLETGAEAFDVVLERRPSALGNWATAWLDRFAGWLAPRQARARAALPAAESDAAGPDYVRNTNQA